MSITLEEIREVNRMWLKEPYLSSTVEYKGKTYDRELILAEYDRLKTVRATEKALEPVEPKPVINPWDNI